MGSAAKIVFGYGATEMPRQWQRLGRQCCGWKS